MTLDDAIAEMRDYIEDPRGVWDTGAREFVESAIVYLAEGQWDTDADDYAILLGIAYRALRDTSSE